MGLMDAINAEATTTIKVGDLYRLLETAAGASQKAKYLYNGVQNGVPYRYIREVITGESEAPEKDNPLVARAEIEISAEEVGKVMKETILSEFEGEDMTSLRKKSTKRKKAAAEENEEEDRKK